jgi:hypothetical protein
MLCFVSSAQLYSNNDESVNIEFYYISFKACSSEFLMYKLWKNVIMFVSKLKDTSASQRMYLVL